MSSNFGHGLVFNENRFEGCSPIKVDKVMHCDWFSFAKLFEHVVQYKATPSEGDWKARIVCRRHLDFHQTCGILSQATP